MLVTVIICTRNRCQQLKNVLNSFVNLSIPDKLRWHLLIVDNGSTDETPQTVQSFAEKLPIDTVFEPKAGLSNARNTGVLAARGDYIVWTDDDVEVTTGWLAAFVKGFETYPDAALFGGKVTPVLEPPTPGWFSDAAPYLTDLLCKRDFGAEMLPLLIGTREPVGACFAVRAKEQKQFLFDPNLGVAPGRRRGGEEIDVIQRILSAGHTGWWLPDAEIKHLIPPARQSLLYISTYYEAEGEREAHTAIYETSKTKVLLVLIKTAFKLIVRFGQLQVARVSSRQQFVRYLIVYANKKGIFKYIIRNMIRSEPPIAGAA